MRTARLLPGEAPPRGRPAPRRGPRTARAQEMFGECAKCSGGKRGCEPSLAYECSHGSDFRSELLTWRFCDGVRYCSNWDEDCSKSGSSDDGWFWGFANVKDCESVRLCRIAPDPAATDAPDATRDATRPTRARRRGYVRRRRQPPLVEGRHHTRGNRRARLPRCCHRGPRRVARAERIRNAAGEARGPRHRTRAREPPPARGEKESPLDAAVS
ncbi:hypothetical protein M885DRAFT_274249 [Pelagophyceae sp. CCMP2097]|nr:hypothetical protein M885DRAFT_274249 [Pelagophyceae sp. CCMP2097]